MKRLRKWFVGGVLAVAMASVVGMVRSPDIYFLIKKNFTIFSEVYREVSLHYVDKVNPEKLMRIGINSMLESLDPYTVLIDEAQNQNMQIITRGSYGGVGLDVGYRGGKVVVIAPMEGYSAYRKGIRAGDVITAVNGVSVQDLKPPEVQNLTTGEPGTTVSMTIERFGIDHPLTFKLERERVEVKNVGYAGLVGADKKVGYILLNRFSQNAGQEVGHALKKLQDQKRLSGLILDLRNNPGGLLDEAVATVDKFVPQGQMVVETRGRLSQHNNTFKTSEVPLAPDLPLVVLQNGGSASASEIVAGALQDLDRAAIIGERSFGKGLVQTVRPLSYNTALKLTISRYYIPSGRSIQSVNYMHGDSNNAVTVPDSLRQAYHTRNGRTVYDGEGISPDVEVSARKPSLLQTVLLQKNMFFEFANQYAANHDSLSADVRSETLYNQFMDFIEAEDFQYTTPSERYLAKIDSSLTRSDDQSNVHVEALEQTIQARKKRAFDQQRSDLEEMIYMELITRYRGQQGQTAASLPLDHMVNEAVEVLRNPKRYSNILTVSN